MSKSKTRNHTVHFAKGREPIRVQDGSVLMDVLLRQDVPVASSCHGKGVCGKCRIQVLSGGENLPPETQLELSIRIQHKIPSGYRVSCQTQITCDILIDTPYW